MTLAFNIYLNVCACLVMQRYINHSFSVIHHIMYYSYIVHRIMYYYYCIIYTYSVTHP